MTFQINRLGGTGSAYLKEGLFAAVRAAIEPRIEDLIRDLLPDGKRQGREWVARNPTRDDRHAGSFSVNLDTGRWIDFATQDKGDLIGLVAYLHGCSQLEAAKELASRFGINPSDHRQQSQGVYLPKIEVQRLTHIVQLGTAAPPESLTQQDSELLEVSRDKLNACMADQFAEPVDLKACPRVEIPAAYTSFDKKGEWLRKQLAEADDYSQTAALALELGRLLAYGVPHQRTIEDVLAAIKAAVLPQMMHSATLRQIARRLEFSINQRQIKALEHPTPEQLARHAVTEVDALSAIPEADLEAGGVFIIRAPHGSGKTQRMASPFAQWSKSQNDGRFVAIAHRRSLVGELANRLACDDYLDVNHLNASGVWALATCLQSIVAEDKGQIFRECRYLFIDEVAQVLEAVAAEVKIAGGKTKADLLAALRQLIRRAKVLVVADAGLDGKTIAFIEECRPGEQFKIVTMRPKPVGRVSFAHGDNALGQAVGELQTALEAGERLWVSAGEKRTAVLLADFARDVSPRVLLITGETTGERDVKAFLSDPENESRRWDCIVHTSTISSGLSIEHHGDPHFTYGMLVASGATVTPADAVQMMRRVRYLKSWSLFVRPNRVRVADAKGAAQGGYEVTGRQFSEYDQFAALIEQSRTTRQADFAAGLWWLLQDFGFEVIRDAAMDDGELGAMAKDRQKELNRERMAAILEAPDLSQQQAENLKKQPALTEAENFALLKHRCKTDLGADTLTLADIEAWQESAAVRRWDRFSAACLGVHEADQFSHNLTLGRYGKQIASEYQRLFDGIHLTSGGRISHRDANTILDRMIDRRFRLAFLGIAPAKYGRYEEKDGTPIDLPRPPYTNREVGDLLRRMGLGIERVKVRAGTDGVVFNITKTGASVPSHEYMIDPVAWAEVMQYATRRNAARNLEPAEQQTPSMRSGVRENHTTGTAPEPHTHAPATQQWPAVIEQDLPRSKYIGPPADLGGYFPF
jgi:putative DNA primase/helicase